MAFDLGMIPTDFLFDIFGKMSPTTISRMRQTNSNVDAFLELNSYRMKVSSKTPSILKISVDAEKMELVYKVAYQEIPKYEHQDLTGYIGLIPEQEFKTVKNPLDTAVMRFQYVFMDFGLERIGESRTEIKANRARQAEVVADILNHLDFMRLQCDWLCVKSKRFTAQFVKEVLSRIAFRKFFIEGEYLSSEVMEWPIKHCERLNIGLLDTPNGITLFNEVFVIGSFYFAPNTEVDGLIKKFLTEIKENPNAIGNHRNVLFLCEGLQKLEGIEGLEDIHAYMCGERVITLSKLKHQGGVVYFEHTENLCNLKFEDYECDLEMIMALHDLQEIDVDMEE